MEFMKLRASLRFGPADHRDAIQKKTFTKWVNNHLRKVGLSCLFGF